MRKLPNNIIVEFYRKLSINYNRSFFKVKNDNQRKFNKLFQHQSIKNNIISQPHWLKNLTNTEIPQDITNFLAMGPKFSIQPSRQDIDIPLLLADVDFLVDKIQTKEKNLLLAQSCNLITNFLHNSNNFDNNNINTILFNKTNKFLKDNPHLRVIMSDKMNVTTIMTVTQYELLAGEILNDSYHYKRINRDPSNSIQQKTNKFISDLVKSKMLTEEEGKSYRSYNGVINKFYGLPKIHKPVLSLRPIISGVNSPNRGLAQLITNILTSAYNKDNNFFVQDSFKFCNFINEFQLPAGYIIISLDARALFNNISLNTAKISITKHWDNISNFCKISLPEFMNAIEILYDTTVFSFTNNFYKQIQGMPMGSPVSPILAQYVMDDLVESCINNLSFNIPFLKKYVDDIILSIPQEGLNEILQVFNDYDDLIKFTIEEEDSDCSVPFLDTKIIRRKDNTIITSWYRKPGSSGRYLNYKSYHQERQKINLVLSMKNRVILTTHSSLRRENLNKLAELFLENSYPKKLINNLLLNRSSINDALTVDNINNTKSAIDNTNNIKLYFSLPFLGNLSHKLKRIFKKFNNVKLSFKNYKTIKQLFSSLKDKDDIINLSNVVYSIPCGTCEKVYIGQTSRRLKDRITSHKSDIKCNKPICTLSKHTLELDHKFSFDHIKILNTENNLHKRLFLEMSNIYKEPNSVNSRKDIENLSLIYTYLLNLNKNNELSQYNS